jgi:hypothetical protein
MVTSTSNQLMTSTRTCTSGSFNCEKTIRSVQFRKRTKCRHCRLEILGESVLVICFILLTLCHFSTLWLHTPPPLQIRERSADASPLTADQIDVLESVRFAFTTRGEEHWQKSYEKLKEYRDEHGHVLVPRQCEIPGLGDWVSATIVVILNDSFIERCDDKKETFPLTVDDIAFYLPIALLL